MGAVATERQADKTVSALETHEALHAAQSAVAGLEGRRVAIFGDYRAANDAGDDERALAIEREWHELPTRLRCARIRLQQATLDHLGPQLPTARERRVRAEAGIERARDRLPYGRGDLPGTSEKLIAGFTEARHELEQSQAAETIITGGIARARDELARLKMIRLD